MLIFPRAAKIAAFAFLSISPATLSAQNVYQIESLALNDQGEKIFPGAREVDYPDGGVVLGAGWNSVTDRPIDSVCLSFSKVSSNGQESEVSIVRIDEKDSLMREVGISYGASASASYGAASGSFSAKRDFVEKSSIENHVLNVLVKSKVVNGVSFIAPNDGETGAGVFGAVTLNEYGSEALGQGEGGEIRRKEFFEKCGDSFVAGIVRGAELYALYNMSAENRDVSKEEGIQLQGKGSYIGFSASGDYSSRQINKQIGSYHTDSITYYHSAHRGLPLPYREEQISDALQYLGNAQDPDEAYPFRLLLRRYDSLPEFDTYIPFGVSIDEQRESYRQRLLGMAGYLNQVIDITRSSGNADPYNLSLRGKDIDFYKKVQDRIYEEIHAVSSELRACFQSDFFGTSDLPKECLANPTPLYSDWLYRLEMPVHKDLHREFYADEASEIAQVTHEIATLQSSYDNHKIRAFWHYSDCNIFGRSCTKRYIEVKCEDETNNPTCRDFVAKKRNAENRLSILKGQLNHIKDIDTRFGRWVVDASRARTANGDINGYLSNEQLDLLKNCMLEQYKPVDAPQIEGDKNPTCSERLLSGKRLAIVDIFVPANRLERDSAYLAQLEIEVTDIGSKVNLLESGTLERKAGDNEYNLMREFRNLARQRKDAGEEFIGLLRGDGAKLRSLGIGLSARMLNDAYEEWLQHEDASAFSYKKPNVDDDPNVWRFNMDGFDSRADFEPSLIEY
jgi:hypothetical protein